MATVFHQVDADTLASIDLLLRDIEQAVDSDGFTLDRSQMARRTFDEGGVWVQDANRIRLTLNEILSLDELAERLESLAAIVRGVVQ